MKADLSSKEKILMHLYEYKNSIREIKDGKRWGLPDGVSTKGISKVTGIGHNHVGTYAKGLIEDGLVEKDRGTTKTVEKGNIYFLTELGLKEAERLLSSPDRKKRWDVIKKKYESEFVLLRNPIFENKLENLFKTFGFEVTRDVMFDELIIPFQLQIKSGFIRQNIFVDYIYSENEISDNDIKKIKIKKDLLPGNSDIYVITSQPISLEQKKNADEKGINIFSYLELFDYLTTNESFFQKIAWRMYETGSSKLEVSDLQHSIEDETEDISVWPEGLFPFLTKDEIGNYQFVHPLFRDFFIARKTVEELKSGNLENINKICWSDQIRQFAFKIGSLDETWISTMEDRVHNAETLKERVNAARILGYLNITDKFLSSNDFIDAVKRGLILSFIYISKVNLSEMKLQDINLSYAKLENVNFNKSDLRQAKLEGTSMINVDINEANISDSNMAMSVIEGSNFSGAILIGTDFSKAKITKTDFIGTKLIGAKFEKSELAEINFTEANLLGSSLRDATLDGVTLNKTDIRQIDITNAKFENVIFGDKSFEDIISMPFNKISKNHSEIEAILSLKKTNWERAKWKSEQIRFINNVHERFDLKNVKEIRYIENYELNPEFIDIQNTYTVSKEMVDYYNDGLPYTAEIDLTNKCDANCVYCYNKKNLKNNDEISFEDLKQLLDDLAKIQVRQIYWLGGEPLLRHDLLDILKYSKKLNFTNILASNGIILGKNPELIGELKGLVNSLTIHLDTREDDIYNKLRLMDGKNLNFILKGIDSLIEKGFNGDSLSICIVITKPILPVIRDYIDWIIDDLQLNVVLLDMKRMNNRLKSIEPSQKAISYVFKYYYLKKGLSFKGITPRLCGPKYYCGTKFHIDCSGNVRPCAMIEDVVGNIYEQSIIHIINENKEDLLYSLMEEEIKGKCGNCHFNKLCFGCRGNAYIFNNNNLNEDPKCILTHISEIG